MVRRFGRSSTKRIEGVLRVRANQKFARFKRAHDVEGALYSLYGISKQKKKAS